MSTCLLTHDFDYRRTEAFWLSQPGAWLERLETRHEGVETMNVAMMAAASTVGGNQSTPISVFRFQACSESLSVTFYIDGRLNRTLKGDRIVAEFIAILDDDVEDRYGRRKALEEAVSSATRA